MMLAQLLDAAAVAPTARVMAVEDAPQRSHARFIARQSETTSVVCQCVIGAWQPLYGLKYDGCDGYYQFDLPSCFALSTEAIAALDAALDAG